MAASAGARRGGKLRKPSVYGTPATNNLALSSQEKDVYEVPENIVVSSEPGTKSQKGRRNHKLAEEPSNAEPSTKKTSRTQNLAATSSAVDGSIDAATPSTKRGRGRPRNSGRQTIEEPQTTAERPATAEPQAEKELQAPEQAQITEENVQDGDDDDKEGTAAEAESNDEEDADGDNEEVEEAVAKFCKLGLSDCGELWRDVMRARKEFSKLLRGCKYKIKTAEAQGLIKELERLNTWYTDQQQDDATVNDAETLQRRVRSLEKLISSTNWSAVPRHKLLLRDLFTEIVPAWMKLLQSAITTLPNTWTDQDKLSDLGQTQRILQLFLKVYSHIHRLDNKFSYSAAIKKPTTHYFYPRCREIEKLFTRQRLRQEIQHRNSADRIRIAALRSGEMLRSEEARRQAIAEMRRQIREEYEQLTATEGLGNVTLATPQHTTASKSGWTDEEDDALIVHLSVNGQLPVEERYYRCVHRSEILQNKSVELIRERALACKPGWELYYTETLGVEIPEWVSSIQ